MNSSLQVDFAGMKLKNPIIAASAGTTKDEEHAARAEEAGCSAVILKSIQEELVNRYNPFPRFAVLRNGISGYNSTSFMSYEQAFEGDIDKYAEEIHKTKQRISIPVIASLNCANSDTWAKYAVITEQAGADAIELVPSCPVGAFVRDAEEFYPIASNVARSVKKVVKIPIGIKLTQQMSNPIVCSIKLEKDGADWLTMFNRTPGLQIDIDTMSPIMHKGICGHGGPWVVQSVMRWIAQTYPHVNIPISATGGVTRWEDVIRYLLSGAGNVQIASLIYMKGYHVIKEIITSLEEYLEKQNAGTIEQLIGRAAKELIPIHEADRSSRYYAGIDKDKCISCKKCKEICIYDAIKYNDEKPEIDAESCDGCGLCEQICNRAISMYKK
jgi:dihydroorotate dehydrogenase (fumarate)